MEEKLRLNAREIGRDATIVSLKELLVNQFQLATHASAISSKDSLFSAGVGLSSLEGMELLAALEKQYGVQITDLESWVDEPPTLEDVAQYLIENSPANESTSS